MFDIVHLVDLRRAYFLSCFILCFGLTAFANSDARSPPENRRSPIRVRSTLTIFDDLEAIRASSCTTDTPCFLLTGNPLVCARVLDVRFLRSEHDDVSLVDNRTYGSQRSYGRQRPRTSCCTS